MATTGLHRLNTNTDPPPEEAFVEGEVKEKKWMRLCEQATVEQNPEKLMTLVKEINRLLEEKEQALSRPQTR